MTTTTTDRAAINRRNAQKSTGPRTPEGKSRSRFNAVKHGMTAKTLVLPGEDADVLQQRIEAWTADLQPRNDLEQFLVERAVQSSWQLERADRAELARQAGIIRAAPAEEASRQQEEAATLGRRLFWDRRGPMLLYPHFPLRDQLLAEKKPRTSFSGLAEDPDDPARLVLRLESTAAGCQWMLDGWAELRAILDEGLAWQPPDKLKAIRLLGRQPIEAVEDDDIAILFLACYVIDARSRRDVDPFAELWNELLPGEEAIIKQRLSDRQVDDLLPDDESAAQAALLGLVGKAVARLEELARAHRQRAEADAAQQAARLSFDPSQEGERLRRYQSSCTRSLFRSLDTLLKIRRAATSGSGECGEGRPSAVASESVAQTQAIGCFTAEIAEAAERKTERREEGTGEVDPAEPAAGIVERPTENEPTPAPSDRRDPRNEPTTPPVAAIAHPRLPLGRAVVSAIILVVLFGAAVRSHRDPRNEATAAARGVTLDPCPEGARQISPGQRPGGQLGTARLGTDCQTDFPDSGPTIHRVGLALDFWESCKDFRNRPGADWGNGCG
jgi:hypothetical protein